MQPMIATLLDLDHALGASARLLLGGGLGLYLKQGHLQRTAAKTNLPFHRMPVARTTQDIDLFVLGEVIVDVESVGRVRDAMSMLGFRVRADAKWLKFERQIDGTTVVLDLMTGPIAASESRVERHGMRIKPRGAAEFHARATDDAVGVEYEPTSIPLTGTRSDGVSHSAVVFVPGAFAYTLMKLGAFNDRVGDPNKDGGRHHALDLYRIAAMLTEGESDAAGELALAHKGHPIIASGVRVLAELFQPANGLGRIRLREHPLCPRDADVDWMVGELRHILGH